MTFKSESIRKRYYSTKEISLMINESVSCIRYWANEFGIGQRSRINKRMFTRADVSKFHLVQMLIRKECYSIEETNMYLKKSFKKELYKPLNKKVELNLL